MIRLVVLKTYMVVTEFFQNKNGNRPSPSILNRNNMLVIFFMELKSFVTNDNFFCKGESETK